jgi:hypothetical protein
MGFRHCDSVEYLSLSTNSPKMHIVPTQGRSGSLSIRLVTVLELFGENTSKTVLLISLYENLLKASFPKSCANGYWYLQLQGHCHYIYSRIGLLLHVDTKTCSQPDSYVTDCLYIRTKSYSITTSNAVLLLSTIAMNY